MQGIGDFLGQLFGPIGTIFHFVFYLPVYNILMIIYQAVNSFFPAGAFAIAIVVLTILIRCALIPLTRRQLQSTRKMQMLQPQLKELQARYRSDPQRLMKEQQALYRENGVSMYGGCLPLLIQMPFLYALFFSFNTLLRLQTPTETVAQHLALVNQDLYPFVPPLAHLPITQFFWTNLAQPDPIHLLPVLAGVLTFFQLRMAMPYRKKVAGAQPDVMTQSTQTTQYIMPFVTVFIGWAVPSGLALYWTISTAFSAVQQFFLSGWGSFWVGIPGMEHLVKEQVLPTATVKPANSSNNSTRALPPASTTPPAEGGLRGWWNNLRETAAAMTKQRMQEREEAERESAKDATNGQSANGNGTSASAANRERRERRIRENPVLVKPAQPAPDAVDAAIAKATNQTQLPEAEIARAAGSTPKATNGNGASNGNGAGKSNGASNGNGTASAASNGNGRTTNQQRKGSGKGSSGSRPRGGRPKGGR